MADKIKKFLTDNKGCPLTPAATKQLFVKFLEFLVKEGYGDSLGRIKVNENGYITIEGLDGVYLTIGDDGVYIGNDNDETFIGGKGIDKVNPAALVGLTHSFNELDPALKAIVDDAIDTATPVACTQQQWYPIKQLLDNSLYLNYNGFSMIRSVSDGIVLYAFGSLGVSSGQRLEISYNDVDYELTITYAET